MECYIEEGFTYLKMTFDEADDFQTALFSGANALENDNLPTPASVLFDAGMTIDY